MISAIGSLIATWHLLRPSYEMRGRTHRRLVRRHSRTLAQRRFLRLAIFSTRNRSLGSPPLTLLRGKADNSRRTMLAAGYMAKRVSDSPEWLAAEQVVDIYSVSGCISKDFANFYNANASAYCPPW